MGILKAKSVYIRDNGTLADLTKKISLYLNEINDDQVVELNKLIRTKEIDILLMPVGMLENIESVIQKIIEINDTNIDSEDSAKE